LLLTTFSLYFISMYALVVSKFMPDTGNHILDAIKYDWYYCFLFPVSILFVGFLFVYINWFSMKFFRHNSWSSLLVRSVTIILRQAFSNHESISLQIGGWIDLECHHGSGKRKFTAKCPRGNWMLQIIFQLFLLWLDELIWSVIMTQMKGKIKMKGKIYIYYNLQLKKIQLYCSSRE